ncbi:MAG: 2-oxo acid dehydrogenase subunit E2, partial [Bdellovibrionota bacterium]
MKVDIKVPAVGESITEATIAEWLKKDGDQINKNDVLLSLETDKATVEVVAENAGKLSVTAKAGTVVKIGASVGSIDTDATGAVSVSPKSAAGSVPSAPAPAPAQSMSSPSGSSPSFAQEVLSPAVRRVVEERGLNPSTISGTGKDGRITKYDAESAPAVSPSAKPNTQPVSAPSSIPTSSINRSSIGDAGIRRVPMTTIRKRIAQRLVEAQHTAAILTTFNEVDMSAVMDLRAKYKDQFKEKYGVGLGFMGFFVKACIFALKEIPEVNANIDGEDTVYHDYYNIGVAVGTEKGLIVPVIKDAEHLSLSGIELAIRNFALKAKDGKISPND